MSTGWTIALVVAVAVAAGAIGYVKGRKVGLLEGNVGIRSDPAKGPPPVVDPKVAAAAKIISAMGPKSQKV